MKSKIRKTVEAISQSTMQQWLQYLIFHQTNLFASVEWTKEDELTLFKQILKVLPENDKMKISRRIDNVEWEKVSLCISTY